MSAIVQQEIVRRIHNLPSLPTVVMELLASLDQEEVDVDTLAHKIAQDQALTAKTLRLSNSSFYGMVKQVTTIQEAIAILGFRTVRSLVTTAALIGTFASAGKSSFSFAPFWRHAIAAAVCAKELAVCRKLNADQAYTAGLLHDIGRLVLVTQFQSEYEAVMVHRAQQDCSLLAAEDALLGVNHAMVGHVLTQHWKFPEAMQQAVANHHNAIDSTTPGLTLVVAAANAIAHALDLSMDPDDLVPSVPDGLWTQLGLDAPALLKVFEKAEQQFEGASLVLSA